MKVIHINTCSYGSTGTITKQLCKKVNDDGGKAYLCVPNGRHNRKKYDGPHIWIGGRFSEDFHLVMTRFTGREGCFSIFSTMRFLRKVKKIKPDLIHLHNLHNSYINLRLLFSFIKKYNIPVVWTLHDCWSFTGHCTHFTLVKCEKWKGNCSECPIFHSYPQSFIDNSKYVHRCKKKWFSSIEKIVLVSPSKWLASLVKESFLNCYQTIVLNNGIDLEIFTPRNTEIRTKYNISSYKYMLLGVSMGWSINKGLDVFIKLSNILDSDKFQIVLVGTDDKVDKQLPTNIISIHRTLNQIELSEIYSEADVFVNPSREENFPTVNIEALACGTPVITFDTGGSPEIIDENSGSIVACDDECALKEEIIRICETKPYSKENCRKRALQFNNSEKLNEYIRLYEELISE